MKIAIKRALSILVAGLLPMVMLVVNSPYQLMAKIKGERTVDPGKDGLNCGGVDRSK